MEHYFVKVIIISGGYGQYLYEVNLGKYRATSTNIQYALDNILRKRLKHQIL